MSRIQANLLLLLAGAVWGMGFVAQSTAMAFVGPFLFIGLRFVAATVAMLPFALIESARSTERLTPQNWRAFAVIGANLFAAISFQQLGIMSTTVTRMIMIRE